MAVLLSNEGQLLETGHFDQIEKQTSQRGQAQSGPPPALQSFTYALMESTQLPVMSGLSVYEKKSGKDEKVSTA